VDKVELEAKSWATLATVRDRTKLELRGTETNIHWMVIYLFTARWE